MDTLSKWWEMTRRLVQLFSASEVKTPLSFAFRAVLYVGALVVHGRWSWGQLVVAAALVSAQPFVEWLIHVYVLHAKPVEEKDRIEGQEYFLLDSNPWLDMLGQATFAMLVQSSPAMLPPRTIACRLAVAMDPP